MSQLPAHVQLAKAILAAAEVREKSFDHAAAHKAEANGDLVDYKRFYKVSMHDACFPDGGNPFIGYPVFLLLTNSWNDAIAWAKENAK